MGLTCALLSTLMAAAAPGISPPNTLAAYAGPAKRMDAIPPTPMGKDHLGRLPSGTAVHLRFPVPHARIAVYRLHLGNVVGFSGKGTRYRLILRRDTKTGPVVYTGPAITNGDAWNARNRIPVDLTDTITKADRKRGYLDIYVTGRIEKDGWTLYRHNPDRPIFATVTILTPETVARIDLQRQLAKRNIALLPLPRHISLTAAAPLRLTPEIRVFFADAASEQEGKKVLEELRAVVAEHTGIRLALRPAKNNNTAAIILRLAGSDAAAAPVRMSPEGYDLHVTPRHAELVGGGPAGLFYGAMTLAQLLRQDAGGGLTAPACDIRDQPAFPDRIIQYDIARGQTVNVDYVKRLIRAFARCKVNGLLFYMEDDFHFRKYPFLGRPDTFTHAKARELSEYAHRFHMQLIPQFESLGHAAAVLGHEELKDLREDGAPWVFCTTNPQTWSFLDDVFGELAEAFPYSRYLHVGGDEFETGFGICPSCRALVDKEGIGSLYAQHMNHLNQLVEKHGRRMLFWTSHSGPTTALSRMTIQYANLLDKRMIPTEWIYHGPGTYPTIDLYRKLGFPDVFCSPAVVDYSRVWPDYRTTFRGISGFFRYGAERHCGGAYCTTWEFMQGALVENSMYGLLYAAECAWNPFDAVRPDFDRRFGAWWLGLDAPKAEKLTRILFQPFRDTTEPEAGEDAAYWQSGRHATHLLWLAPKEVLPSWVLRTPRAVQKADLLARNMETDNAELTTLANSVKRHALTLQAARQAFAMLRYAAHKALGLRDAAQRYARQQKGPATAAGLDAIAERLAGLAAEARNCAKGYTYFVTRCGAYAGDAKNLENQARELDHLATSLAELAAKIKNGTLTSLPPGARFGLITGQAIRLGEWTPETVSENGTSIRFPISGEHMHNNTEFQVSWNYRTGAHGLTIQACRLVCNGKTLAEDRHQGWAGSGSHDNTYTLSVGENCRGKTCEIVGDVVSRGGTDSHGEVWILLPDPEK